MKRAQTTVFIALGLILVLLVASVFFLLAWDEPETPVTEEGIRQYMKFCLRNQAEKGMHMIGMYSGYIDKPTREQIADISKTEEDLMRYMDTAVDECIDNYPENINLVRDNHDMEVVVGDFIKVTMNNPYKVLLEGKTLYPGEITNTLKIRYKTIHDTVKEIEEERTDYIPDSPALQTYGLVIEAGKYSDGELWLITDYESEGFHGPFYFSFLKVV